MNINDVSKREVLDFDQFKAKVHDGDFKPLSKENQTSEERTGLHKIKREPAYDWVGYADAIFSPEKAGIEVPGYNAKSDREFVNAIGGKGLPETGSVTNENEEVNEDNESSIIRLEDFE